MVNGAIITSIPQEVIQNLTKVIGALGGVIFLYLIFNVINFLLNRKRAKEIKNINRKLNEIKSLLENKK